LVKLALTAVVLLLAGYAVPSAAGAGSAGVGASGYRFAQIAALNDPAPGGGTFINDFEPTAINNNGQVAFTADVSSGEGVFVARGGQILQLTRSGLPGPGGVTMSSVGELGRLAENDGGDVALSFLLDPFGTPTGVNGGTFRYSHATNLLTGVEVPGTPAPGGGTFEGNYFNLGMNNRGDIVFPGLATGTAVTPPGTPPNYNGMALGLFVQGKNGTASRLVMPGDAAPGGRVFDDAWNGSINSGGDVAFSGHVLGDQCVGITLTSPAIVCGDSLYLRDAATGTITSIAHQGDPAPGGGNFTVAFGALINDSGQVAFVGNLGSANPVPPSQPGPCAVFRYQDGVLSSVARPGDPMPGGGNFVSTTCGDEELGINNRGDICFGAQLDSVTNGLPDTGVYCSVNGVLRVVARSGMVIPAVGTISYLGFAPPMSGVTPDFRYGGATNSRGQVLIGANLTSGTGVLMVATP
jgi:hypothetical protein